MGKKVLDIQNYPSPVFGFLACGSTWSSIGTNALLDPKTLTGETGDEDRSSISMSCCLYVYSSLYIPVETARMIAGSLGRFACDGNDEGDNRMVSLLSWAFLFLSPWVNVNCVAEVGVVREWERERGCANECRSRPSKREGDSLARSADGR